MTTLIIIGFLWLIAGLIEFGVLLKESDNYFIDFILSLIFGGILLFIEIGAILVLLKDVLFHLLQLLETTDLQRIKDYNLHQK